MSILTGLILLAIVLAIAWFYFEIHYFRCFRCGKISPRKKGYCLTQNRGWLCQECYKIINIHTPGLMIKKNGILKFLKEENGDIDPRQLFFLIVVLLILTVHIAWNYIVKILY